MFRRPPFWPTLFFFFFLVSVGALAPAGGGEGRPLQSLLGAAGANGGVACAGCTIVTGLAEQLTALYNISVSESLARLCAFLPAGFRQACDALVEAYGPEVIALLEKRETPDVVCLAVGLCKTETGDDVCHLFPLPPHYHHPSGGAGHGEGEEEEEGGLLSRHVSRAARLAARVRSEQARAKPSKRRFEFPDLCNITLVKPICDLVERFGKDHLPVDDLDGDFFSDVQTFRGDDWRGKDCDDADGNVYPGRRTTDDALVDTNCNGIFGRDPDSGQTYEALWCNGTGQTGTVLLGDSVGAHFHIPPAWLTSRDLSVDVFKDLFFVLENEFDWPMMSSETGFTNSTWPDISGPVDSSYLRLREINLCNHRDFQNLGVNGARSSAMADDIVRSFARRASEDNPVLLTYALVGNDVCSSHHDAAHMTTPEEFYANSLKTFRYVDERVAPGSVLLAIGLIDGRILYDALHGRIHPIGSLRDDVTYAAFYDYLNCLQLSPCFGWMNSNATWRNFTTERAFQLNAALKELVAVETFRNLRAHYFDPPLELVLARWRAKGGEVWQLIEPVDGFHPNQQANFLLTGAMWELMRNETPWAIPPTNPNNAKIRAKFGDQGGYR